MPGRTILIDTASATARRARVAAVEQPQGTWLDDLAAAGVKPEQVDPSSATHLHVDHVGWNTRFETGSGCRPSRTRAT